MGDINLQLALAGEEAPGAEAPGAAAGSGAAAAADSADSETEAEDDELSAGSEGSHELVAAPRELDY
jgi:hypothetical protein